MEKYSAEQIQKKYDALPPTVKEVFESMESAEALQQIGKEHGLMLDKLGELADETGLVILGLTHPKDYINNLSARLSVEKETAKNIAEKVNQKVFQKIREELKKIHGIEENAEEKLIITESKFAEAPKPAALPAGQAGLPAIIIKPEIVEMPTPALPKTPIPNIDKAITTPTPKIEEIPVPVVKPPVLSIQPSPSTVSPFEQKLHENEILRSPIKPAAATLPVQSTTETAPRYTGKDPYREPTE